MTHKDLGSAKTGTGHYMMQKATSIGLMLLGIVLSFELPALFSQQFSHQAVLDFIENPTNAVLLGLFIAAGAYHFAGHAREVIEDYIHHEGLKIALLVVVKFGAVLFATAAIYSILDIAMTTTVVSIGAN